MTDRIDAATVPTPAGDLSVLVHDDVVVACGFAPVEAHHARLPGAPPVRRVGGLAPFTTALAAYVEGDLTALDPLPVSQQGGPFWQATWKVMREVPAGEVITYAELAARAGNPRAIRAAGTACAQNRIAPIVPCHRIVRTGAGLGGYYYGLGTKEWLLAHERGEA